MERFVWIGPLRQPGPAGDEARAWCRTLLAAGAEVAAVDPDPAPPAAAPPPPWLVPLLDGPALTRRATCVWHGPPADLRQLTDVFPAKAAARRVAVVRAPEGLGSSDIENFAGFDEVWVPTTLERERLSAAEVPRDRIHVLVPGFDVEAYAAPFPLSAAPWACVALLDPVDLEGATRFVEAWNLAFLRREGVDLILVVPESADLGSVRAGLARELAGGVDGFDPERSPAVLRSMPADAAERAQLWHGAAVTAFPCRADALNPLREAAAAGTPRFVLDWAGAADHACEGTATLLPASADSWQQALRGAFEHPAEFAPVAVLAAASARDRDTFEARGRAVLGRSGMSRRPEARILDRVLPAVGLRTPRELIEGCRSRIVICVFKPSDDSWKASLRRHLRTHGPSDDVTFCLWADAQSTDGLDALAAAITAETESHAGPTGPPDLQLLVAPADHIPWDAVEPVAKSVEAQRRY